MEGHFIDNAHEGGRLAPVRPSSSLASTPSNSDESLLSLDVENTRYRRPNVLARFVARFPWVIGLVAAKVGLVCLLLSVLLIPFPDFSDPTKGFNTHGTEINRKSAALGSLMLRIQENKDLIDHRFAPTEDPRGGSDTDDIKLREKRSLSMSRVADCGSQQLDLGKYKVVFESMTPGEDLFTLKSFQSICDIETTVIRPSISGSDTTCPFMPSLPLYAMLTQQKSCSQLTESDIRSFRDLLAFCYPYYKKGCLLPQGQLCNAPTNCTKYDIPFNTFTYLADTGFNPICETKLQYTMLLYNWRSDDPKKYFLDTFSERTISHGSVKVAAVFEGPNTKFTLFEDYFLKDMKKYILCTALVCILIILLLYLWSFVLLVATALTVLFSFALAYVIYYYVFQIKFFPFINILAALILIAIGADDVFIFFDAWKHAKKSDGLIPFENRVARTFNHAAMSIMVTSLTTAGSFFANFVTDIVSIRCFALFAGTAVIANFFFMITFIPSVLITQSKITAAFSKHFRMPSSPGCYRWVLQKRAEISNVLFCRVIPKIIEKCWHILILVFLSIGIGGMCVVFYKPRLQVPASADFQLFPSDQYMEKWDRVIKNKFLFIQQGEHYEPSIWFVWGIKPGDNGVWYDSEDLGTVNFDDTFDPYSRKALLWLKDFLNSSVHNDLFHFSDAGKNEFFGVFGKAIKSCSASPSEKCPDLLNDIISQLPMSLVFDRKNNTVKAMYIKLKASHPLSTSYQKMDRLYHNLSKFFDDHLANAPPGISGGFWTSVFPRRLKDLPPFGFYDLQVTLASGTQYSIMLSLLVASILMFLTSLNLLLTVYAMITILLAISVTIGCLVLMGWHLNVVESITISLAVGMSIDFTIHYGVSYRLSKERESAFRTRESFHRVGSAVIMAATTTFVAGAAMIPSHILAYSQLGTFLMLVMTFSWLYSTFFFQSLCHIIGPRGNFCQVPFPCWKKKQSGQELDVYESHPSLQLRDPTMNLDPLSGELQDDDTFLLPT